MKDSVLIVTPESYEASGLVLSRYAQAVVKHAHDTHSIIRCPNPWMREVLRMTMMEWRLYSPIKA